MLFTSFYECFAGQKSIVEKLWLEFFSDPSQWWDHRSEKVRLVVVFLVEIETRDFSCFDSLVEIETLESVQRSLFLESTTPVLWAFLISGNQIILVTGECKIS
jgi:hypothetical protein